MNRVTLHTDKLGATTGYTYTATGKTLTVPVARTNRNMNITRYTYDGVNRLTATIDPEGAMKTRGRFFCLRR